MGNPAAAALLANTPQQVLAAHGLLGLPRHTAVSKSCCPACLDLPEKLQKTGALSSADGWGKMLGNLGVSRLGFSLSEIDPKP